MLKSYTLLISIILFSLGVILINDDMELLIVSFINHSLHLHLDFTFRSLGLYYCGCLFIVLSVIADLSLLYRKGLFSRHAFYNLSYAVLIIFYFFFLWKDSINMPIMDDYRVLIFFSQYAGKETFAEKWQMIIRAPLECRIMEVPKLCLLGIYDVFGSINFKWLIMFNGCLLLVICKWLFKSFNHPQKDVLQLAFLFLVLQFQSFDSAFWAVAGISYYWTFLFVTLAIRRAQRGSQGSFYLSLLFATLASFTLGNGLIVFPICCIIFYRQGMIRRALIATLLMSAVYIAYFYFWPYPEEASQWEFNPFSIFVFALGFLGSSMQFMYSLYIPVLAGLMVMAVFIYATYRKYYKENFFIWALLLFIIISAFITAPLRLKWGPLQSRYGFYSIIAIILSIMMAVEMSWNNISSLKSQISNLLLPTAICYSLLSGIMFYPEAPVRKAQLHDLENDWKNGRPVTIHSAHTPDKAVKYLDDAKKSGIWKVMEDQ